MSFTLEPKPRGNVIVKAITVDGESRIAPAAQKFFDSEPDEASPYFIKGVDVYEGNSFVRYIENPAIDPFEGL